MLTDADLLNARILIVDDEAAHVRLLQRLLQDAGYLHVDTALDPQTVATLHREHDYALILLDLQMPVLDGFGVMKALQADAGGSTVLPVIALTAQPGHKLLALQAGARDFISKPFDVVEVKLRIRHMLEARVLYRMLEAQNEVLERKVQERTAALQASEDRYRSLTELAADWHWEQNEAGEMTSESGLAREMLGLGDLASGTDAGLDAGATWDVADRSVLLEKIAARRPFLDLVVQRSRVDGSRQQFRISGQPMLDRGCRYAGFRGVGTLVLPESVVR